MRHRTVGVIGGMGPMATARFFERLTAATPATRDQDHLHVIIDSDPRVPDRTAYLLGRGDSPGPALVRIARRLAAAGSDLLVMPCNTAHAFASEITAAVSIPLVHWIETAAAAAAARSGGTVAVLATDGTLLARLYQQALEAHGLRVIIPDATGQAAVMDLIYGQSGVKAGIASPAVRDALFRAARAVVDRGADLLVLGCTELPVAVPASDPGWPADAIDPADAVARRVIELAGPDRVEADSVA